MSFTGKQSYSTVYLFLTLETHDYYYLFCLFLFCFFVPVLFLFCFFLVVFFVVVCLLFFVILFFYFCLFVCCCFFHTYEVYMTIFTLVYTFCNFTPQFQYTLLSFLGGLGSFFGTIGRRIDSS